MRLTWSCGEKDMKEIRYDKDVDALVIVFLDEKIAYEEEVDGLIVGFSASKEPVWFEILDASKSFLPKIIQKISESGVSVSIG